MNKFQKQLISWARKNEIQVEKPDRTQPKKESENLTSRDIEELMGSRRPVGGNRRITNVHK